MPVQGTLMDDDLISWNSGSEADEDGLSANAPVTDAEEWQDYHSEELVTLWHVLQDRIASMGVYILDECHISDFTDFCFRLSSGKKPPC